MVLEPLRGHLPKLIYVAGAAAAFVRAATDSPAALGNSRQLLEPPADVQYVQGVCSSPVLGGVCGLWRPPLRVKCIAWKVLPAGARLHVTMRLVIARGSLLAFAAKSKMREMWHMQ